MHGPKNVKFAKNKVLYFIFNISKINYMGNLISKFGGIKIL